MSNADIKIKSSDTKTILVVDDAFINRIILKRMFKGKYKIMEAADGAEAMKILRSRDITMVLLDIIMPIKNGYEVLAEMKADTLLFNIPVIVITGESDEASQIKALDHGAQDVIVKPFNPEIVRHRVNNIILRMEADRKAEESRIYKQLLKQAEIDDKTNLYTKQAFCRKTCELILDDITKKYVIFRWDIDRFKVYNDMFGIEAGDRLLEEIGEAYRKDMFGRVVISGHLEADHFASCMEYEDFVNNDIVDKIQKYLSNRNPEFGFVVRAGIYEILDPRIDVSLMCDRALLALKSIKNDYTKRFAWYEESMREALREEQALIERMDYALENGQFVVYYQPQYNYINSTLTGAEALVRWNHPDKGLIYPNKFIPVFEKNGFIRKLDENVWEQVCINIRKWLDEGLDIVPISLNISRHDIYGVHPIDVFTNLLKKYNLQSSYFRLEITESAFMQDPDKLISTVNELKKLGFKVEMDDFGSGYSSLNTLKEVYVDVLKLDMKFLESGDDSSRAGKILSSVIRMTNWLDMPVTAEGVETKLQADYLKSLGCINMQGYFFSKPIPALYFESILREAKQENLFTETFDNNVEGSLNFLDASTQTTLIFNSFVGGAQVIELFNNNVEALRINDHYYEVLGLQREDYEKHLNNVQDRFYPEYRDKYLAILRLAVKTGNEQKVELKALPIKEGGSDIWMLVSIKYLTSTRGRHVLYEVVENITDRKKLEQYLYEADEKLLLERKKMEYAIQSAKLMIWEYDIINKTHTLIGGYSNMSIPEYLENAPESVIERNMVAEDSIKDYLELHNMVKAGVGTVSKNILLRTSPTTFQWRRIRYKTIFANGKPVTAIGSAANIETETDLLLKNREYEAVLMQSGKRVLKYDIKTGAGHIYFGSDLNSLNQNYIEDYVEESIRRGWVAQESLQTYRDFFQQMKEGKLSGSCDGCLYNSKGEKGWYHADYSMISDEFGEPTHSIISFYDNTKQREKEIAYQKWQNSLNNLLSENAVYLEANLSADEIVREENLGYENEGREGNRFSDYISYGVNRITFEEDISDFCNFFSIDRLLNLYNSGKSEDVLRYRAIIDGRAQWYRTEIQMAKYPDTGDIKAFIVYTNIDEEMKEKERLEGVVNFDALTGLYNRLAMKELVNKYLSKASKNTTSALIMLDIDNFKIINDTMGHQYGDEALARIAERMRGCFRSDDYLCRFGGDEFMIFMKGQINKELVAKKCEEILNKLYFKVGELEVTVSAGATLIKGSNHDFDELYVASDKALYEAKYNGKNTYCLQEK